VLFVRLARARGGAERRATELWAAVPPIRRRRRQPRGRRAQHPDRNSTNAPPLQMQPATPPSPPLAEADIIIIDRPDCPSSIVAPNRNITKAESATAPPATSPSNAAGSIEGDRGLVLLDEIARIVDLLQSDSICPREGLIAGKIPLWLVEHRLIMRQLRFSLVERNPVIVIVNKRDNVAGGDLLIVCDGHAH
jgi:hypothetical protein